MRGRRRVTVVGTGIAVLVVAAGSIGYTAGTPDLTEPKGVAPTYNSHVPENLIGNNLGFGATKQRNFSHGLLGRFGYNFTTTTTCPPEAMGWSDMAGFVSGRAQKIGDFDDDGRFDFGKPLTAMWFTGFNPDMGRFWSNTGAGFFEIEALRKNHRGFPAREEGHVGLEFMANGMTYGGPTIPLVNTRIYRFPAFGQPLSGPGTYRFIPDTGSNHICIYDPVVIPVPGEDVIMKLEMLQIEETLNGLIP